MDYIKAGEKNGTYHSLEQRKYKRIKNGFTLRFRIRPQDTKEKPGGWDIALLQNLSAGGLLFTSDKAIEMGSFLDFSLNSPASKDPINGIGKIIRVEKRDQKPVLYYLAVFFTQIDEEDREAINNAAKDYGSLNSN